MTPSAWPVVTGSGCAREQVEGQPESPSRRGSIGRPSSPSSNSSRRLAASATAKLAEAELVAVGRPRAGERAAEQAELARLVDEPVARRELGVRAAGRASNSVEQLARRPVEAQLGAAMQAGVVLEEDEAGRS